MRLAPLRAGLLLSCFGLPAYGQAGPSLDVPAQVEPGGQRVEEVVVTAQRRSEKLQSVPVSVSSFSAKRRDRLGIKTIQDFANFTPGVSYSTSLDRITMRGIGRFTNLNGSDPGVATYNDGFYTASTVEASKTPMFVDRVEFLRGPQGTLFGRNSVGGAINIYSQRPTDHFTGEVRSSFDTVGGLLGEGFVSGPLIGGLKARLSLQLGPKGVERIYQNNGGAGDEGGLAEWLGELQLQYDFAERSQIWLKYSHAEWDNRYRTTNFVGQYQTTALFPNNTIVPNPAFGYTTPNPGAHDPRTINTDSATAQHLQGNHTFVINGRTALGEADLKYVGGYQTYRYTQFNDLDSLSRDVVRTNAGSPFGYYTYDPNYRQRYLDDKQYYSNELTISNHTPSRLNYILGLYQYHENYLQTINWSLAGNNSDDMSRAFLRPVNPLTGKPSAANPTRSFYAGTGYLTTNSYAAFGQTDFEIRERLKLTAGLRYSLDEKAGDETFRLVAWNPTIAGPYTPAYDVTRIVTGVGDGTGAIARSQSGDWRGMTGRISLDYRTSEGDLLYGSYSRGLKSGGFNLGSWSKETKVDEETVDAFEVGAKFRLARKLSLNVAAYYDLYDNAQVPLFVAQAGGISVQSFYIIPKSEIKGVEVESAWFPLSWLELDATYAFTDARITETTRDYVDDNAPGKPAENIEGNWLPQTSAHQVAVSAIADIPISYGSLYASGSFLYRSAAYYGVFSTPNYRAPGWNQVDLRTTWVAPSRKFSAIVFVRNLFDSLGYDGASSGNGASSLGYDKTYSFTPPRSIGVELQYRF